MKKLLKKKKRSILDYKAKMVYDPKLDEVDLEKIAPQKVEEANRRLKNMKFPESFFKSSQE